MLDATNSPLIVTVYPVGEFAGELAPHGSRVNIGLYENHPDAFRQILARMRERVPGISEILPELTPDGYLLLRFQDGSFKTPFLDRYVSDGTIKMFAYLVLPTVGQL